MDLVRVRIVEEQLSLRPGPFCEEPEKSEYGVTTYLGNREVPKVFEQGRKINQTEYGERDRNAGPGGEEALSEEGGGGKAV